MTPGIRCGSEAYVVLCSDAISEIQIMLEFFQSSKNFLLLECAGKDALVVGLSTGSSSWDLERLCQIQENLSISWVDSSVVAEKCSNAEKRSVGTHVQ